MGIRVHKFLGYGLTDIQTSGGRLADPRIDEEALRLPLVGDITVTDYKRWLAEQGPQRGDFWCSLDRWLFAALDRGEERLGSRDLTDCVVYRDEYGLPNVLGIQPLSCANWSHFDDMIDWVQETYLAKDGPQANWVYVMPHGIYPFSGSYMDTRTGNKLPDFPTMEWVRAQSAVREGRLDHVDDRIAEKLGFADDEMARRLIAPTVPDEVRALAEFLGLFTRDDVWLQLRPLLYTYWA